MHLFSNASKALLSLLSLACLLATPLASHATEATQTGPHRVLFLSSYNHDFPVVSHQLEGVLQLTHFDYRGRGVSLEVHMMDTKRYAPAGQFPIAREQLKGLVANHGAYDLIISADDNALHFLRKEKDALFGESTPVVFFGVNDKAFARESVLEPEYTGIIEKEPIRETVESAFSLLPQLRTLWVLVDTTTTALGEKAAFLEEVPAGLLDRCTLLDLGRLSYEEAAKSLIALGESDAVYLISAYQDKEASRLSFWQSLNWIKTHTSRPIFLSVGGWGIGEGVAGGKVTSHSDMARLAVDYAQRILSGEPVSSLPLIENPASYHMFDYLELANANADLSKIPEGARLLNPPNTFWHRHWRLILLCAAIVVSLAVFAAVITLLYLNQKKTLRRLKESEERMSSLFANSYAPMLIVETENKNIVDANPAASAFYGYSRDALLSKNWLDISDTDSNVFDDNIRKLQEGSKFVIQTKHTRSSGERLEVEVILTLIYRGSLPYLFAIVQDVTSRNQAQRDLLNSKEALEEANRAKEQFLAVMSHELRTPLNPIMGFASLLLSDNPDPEARESLETIIHSAERMLKLIDNILSFTNLRSKSARPKPTPICMKALLDEAMHEYRTYPNENAIQLAIESSGNLDDSLQVWSDPTMLRQILDNLVSNACKFTKKGSVRIACALDQSPDSDREIICVLSVEDSGIGIPKDLQTKIFNPFTQVERCYTRKFEGAGLGLSIASELVKKLRGTVTVQSELGKGSKFQVILPLAKANQEGKNDTANTLPEPPRSQAVRYAVLLVEDNEDNAHYIKRCLERAGTHVEHAADGVDGCARAQEKRFDAILMDLSMPRMDGLTAMRKIKSESQQNRDTPIFVITAHADNQTKERCLENGAVEVMTKPIVPERIYQRLENLSEAERFA
ncbi:response regulator [Pelagicoccus sp. SDUM812003]|uniref:response regulator n=1 Tax=Pelagicoccus sp. SDUM812003 TaxID=3041267 RepID=UPI002810617F|nr:response regulator [Pelagicoccus sp. SDUM812003]MDQ8205084.1 response regulator [Pelagicoccus sp. SDUM812003]